MYAPVAAVRNPTMECGGERTHRLRESVRGQERKERILAAVADLLARRGYHAVSMSDVGAAVGIVGRGIYRHFAGKSALLVALFERDIDGLLASAAEVVTNARDDHEALTALIEGQVAFVIESSRARVGVLPGGSQPACRGSQPVAPQAALVPGRMGSCLRRTTARS